MEWISVEDRLPENSRLVLCLPQKGAILVGQYTKGHEIEYEDWDYDGEYDPVEEKNGTLYLKEGWYEECEQYNGEYDSYFMKRNITHWMPLPPPPKTN